MIAAPLFLFFYKESEKAQSRSELHANIPN
jgi:hypothetical protein